MSVGPREQLGVDPITLDSHAIGESMRHEQEVRVMPYARCSECGDAMQVEKVSNGIMMMWHGAH
jgi:hypothetical protein